jgi:hypothetical protein
MTASFDWFVGRKHVLANGNVLAIRQALFIYD